MRNTIFIIIIIVITFLIASMNQNEQIESVEKKPTIALSTFSLYEIARNIAGDTADTFMILPFGVDAHSYEPTPKQVTKLYKSDLVVYSGAGLEPWISGFDFQNKSIDMSQYVDLKEIDGDEHDHHGHGDNHGKERAFDPHYWLDIDNMIKATEYITKELIELFPQNKDLYIKNRDAYIGKLRKLDADYKDRLSSCKLDTIAVNHNAFSYISSRYGFHVESLNSLSPESEPSAKNMAHLIEYVKKHQVSTIFFESFVNDRAIKSIANEAGVSVDVLQPLGNITADEAAQKLTYDDIMRSNLNKISNALECR
jgi:zinc transport system substrate-binding protein